MEHSWAGTNFAGHCFDQGLFRSVLGHFASGVVIVTGDGGGGPVGFTCQSFFSLSLDPPLVAFAPAVSSTSWPAIAESGHCVINILAAHQRSVALNFARSGGDKFAGVDAAVAANGAPRLLDVAAWLECSLQSATIAGDHYLVVAAVTDLGSDAEQRPILFYRGGFGGFDPHRQEIPQVVTPVQSPTAGVEARRIGCSFI